MENSPRFGLRTFFGTYVIWAPGANEGRHADLGFAEGPFLELHRMENGNRYECATFDAFVVEPHGHFLVIRNDGRVLCADRDGSVRFKHVEIGGWEQFTAVPMEAIASYKSREAKELDAVSLENLSGIPKIIHQIYLHKAYPKAELPGALAANVANIRKQNPEYDHILWTDRDVFEFIYRTYGYEILSAYLSIHPYLGAARADLFRYLVCYAIGGIYLDIKSGLGVPLREILLPDDAYLLRQWSSAHQARGIGICVELASVPGGEYQQWWIAAAPRHPFLKSVIEAVISNINNYVDEVQGRGRHAVLKTTGPIAYTRAIHPILNEHPHRILDKDKSEFLYNVVGVPTEELFPRHYATADFPVILK